MKFATDHSAGVSVARTETNLRDRIANAGAEVETDPFVRAGIGPVEERAEITVHCFFFGVAAVIPGTGSADDGAGEFGVGVSGGEGDEKKERG